MFKKMISMSTAIKRKAYLNVFVQALLCPVIIYCGIATGQDTITSDRLIVYAPSEVKEQTSRLLNEIISVRLDNIPLENAMQYVADKGSMNLAFSKNITLTEWRQHISVDYERATVLGALYGILEEAGRNDLRLVLSNNGQLLVVVKRSISDFFQDDDPRLSTNAQPERGMGRATGEVRDANTGETLPGANVLIQGTSIGVATDVDGRYVLRQVPAGDQIMEIRFIGFETQQIPIRISADETIEQTIMLTPDLIEGDEIFVVAYQRGQARALTRQRESVNIRNVMSSEQMDRFSDVSVAGALQRIPGMGHGGANIRGVGADMSKVTMDGQRMGSTGAGDRGVDIGTISIDMVQELEVIKVITPDMDADALSGVININTRRPVGGRRTLDTRIGGGGNARYLGLTGPNSRISLSYGDSPRDDLSYGVNFSYQNNTSAREQVNVNWATGNFGQGPVDILDNLRTSIRLSPTERYGTGMQFTFQPTSRTTFHLQGMFNYSPRNRSEYGMRFNPQIERYTSQFQTGPMAGNGTHIRYDATLDEQEIFQYTFRSGARHLFQHFEMEYSIGWGHGRMKRDQYTFDFRTRNVFDYFVNIDDRMNPLLEIAPYCQISTFPVAQNFNLNNVNHEWDNHIDNEFRASVDFMVPIRRGQIKFGSSALMTLKNGNRERYLMEFDRITNVGQFSKSINGEWNVFERNDPTYLIPWLIDTDEAKKWYYALYPHFRMNLETWAERAETSNYAASEYTYAGYSMATWRAGWVTMLGGVRVEHTGSTYDGRDGTISETGRFSGARDVKSSNSYTHLFPNAQLVFHLTRFSNIRLAFSRSIGRPRFDQLSPYILRNYENETMRQGNPNLKPMLSNNLDFLVEHYFMNVGQFSAGLFYKQLSDFVFNFTEILGEQGLDGNTTYAQWRRTTFLNGREATVYGFETSWQQHLEFLPGFLANLGIYANYSFTRSLADVDRRDTEGNTIHTRLQGQRPHVFNFGLDYNLRGFSTQVSYRLASPSISAYGDLQWVPEIQLRERVYFDRFNDTVADLSFSARYRLTSNFRIWADVTNLLNAKTVNYFYNRDFYPQSIEMDGTGFNFGLRYSF